MSTLTERVGSLFVRGRRGAAELVLPADRSRDGALRLANDGDGRYVLVERDGRPAATPDAWSQYLYVQMDASLRRRLAPRLVIEVDYFGTAFATFRLQYVSTDPSAPYEGRYKEAAQWWDGERTEAPRWRRALFLVEDFDADRFQNLEASFRFELRQDFYVGRIAVSAEPPPDRERFAERAPLPAIRKSPDRVYPIWWMFVELTNLCNFKCTFCPDEIMERPRGMMDYEEARRIFDEIARQKGRLGPLYPVKLHQMGEPTIHPRLVDIVAYAESRGVAIELNTNCSLLTPELVDGLYGAGLTNLILSYQTPDEESFKTRKAKNKKLTFETYLDKVRMAVERKVALGAPTHLEIDVMNTAGSEAIRIVGEEAKASRILLDWIAFARSIERRYGLPPRRHDLDLVEGGFRFLDHDEDTGRYELLPGVDLVWKRLHSWGNVIDPGAPPPAVDGYCPAPNEQFVILWDGRVTVCCTDYEGTLAVGNVKEQSIEEIWTGPRWRHLRERMWANHLDSRTCRVCKGVEPPGPPLVQIEV